MKKLPRQIAALIACGAILWSCCAVQAGRPIVLLFEASVGEGASRELALSATKAIRNYLRETQRVEATVFDRESPAVARAILDKRLTPDQIASYSTEQERLKVAEVLGFDYACGSEIASRDGNVTVKLWLTKVGGEKADRWEAIGEAASSGAGALNLENAIQAATSAAVFSAARRAFVGLAAIPQPAPDKPDSTTALPAGESSGATGPTAADYAREAEKSLKAGNVALAIHQYSRAVDVDPTNPDLRLKLADAYATRGMFDDAERELARAEKAGASQDSVVEVRKRIAALKSDVDAASPTVAGKEPVAHQRQGGSVVIAGPDPVLSKIVEGDKLWQQGKADEAAEAYREAVKLNPKEWRAWERIAIVTASMSLFSESRNALEQLKKIQPEPSLATVEARYEMLRKAFDKQFEALLKHYETSERSFANGGVTRENYYNEINGLALRLEAMAKFVDALEVPAAKQPANLRRSLACGLLAQAALSLLDYLETNSKAAKSNASVFASQARAEHAEAQKLESNKVVVEK